MAAECGHTALETQRQTWRCIRKLSIFLHEINAAEETPLPVAVADDFRRWLSESKLCGSTAQSVLNIVLRLLTWCSRNAKGVIDARSKLVVRGFVRSPPKQKRALDEQAIKRILAACYSDIDRVEADLAFGARLTKGTPTDDERPLAELLRELLSLGSGLLPTQKTINRSGKSYARRVDDAGGLRRLTRLLWITPESMLPYYLAVQIQTGGNPMAIAEISRDCVAPHPLRADLERLIWLKRRANREQRCEFPAGRDWSAPSLIRRICRLNSALIQHCSDTHQDKAFICLKANRVASVPCFQMFHHLLDAFIQRHDLPPFDFHEARKVSAAAHHRATRSMEAARSRLDHKSLRTTQLYTTTNDVADHHDQVIRHFQGELIRLSKSPSRTPLSANSAQTGVRGAGRMETVFGFGCRDPYAGVSPGSRVGALCLQFQRCATCPGAIVPVDDPRVVARLLAASQGLAAARERAQSEGWWERYLAIYEPTRRILDDSILSLVDPAIREAAMQMVSTQPMLWLE